MTNKQFDTAHRAFCRRRPFRPFFVEFISGKQVAIGHPESVRNEAEPYVMRFPDGGYMLFTAESVARLFDGPLDVSQ